jgi:hypothetical protein
MGRVLAGEREGRRKLEKDEFDSLYSSVLDAAVTSATREGCSGFGKYYPRENANVL